MTAFANTVSPFAAPLVFTVQTGSTNEDALRAARAGAAHGTVYVADAQTAGRGRRGRSWQSEPGANLTFSVVLRPSWPAERAAGFSLAVGLAVRDVVARHVNVAVRIKWPNDVLAADQKVCGILVESALAARRVQALVVGIGLNVKQRTFPAEIPATSLALLGASIERDALLSELLASLQARFSQYDRDGLQQMLPELTRHDALAGRRARIDQLSGVVVGIAPSGALSLRDEAGRLHDVVAGTVELEPR